MSINREELAEKIEGILADNFYLGEHGFNATQQAGIDKLLSLFETQEKQIREELMERHITWDLDMIATDFRRIIGYIASGNTSLAKIEAQACLRSMQNRIKSLTTPKEDSDE